MAVELVRVEFGLKDNPRSTLAPIGFNRGENSRSVAIWTRGFTRPQESPIIVMADLLPSERFPVKPFVRRTGNERQVRLRIECVNCVRVPSPLEPQTQMQDLTFQRAMGTHTSFNITFGADGTGNPNEPVPLDDEDIPRRIVVRDITLRWKADNSIIADTVHRVYVILGAPVLPWSADPIDRDRWLWPEVLDFACAWADGATTPDGAVESIARQIFALGGRDELSGGLRYNRSSFVSASYFNCADFLDHLQLKPGTASKVDCQDLASIISTFANAVGCHLYQSQCSGGVLRQDVRLLGQTGPPQPPKFGFHEMVWDGYAGADDHVWDACISAAGQPFVRKPFADYSPAVFTKPTAVKGPAYAGNRFVKPRPPVILTTRAEEFAYERHPEIRDLVDRHVLNDIVTEFLRKLLRIPAEFVPIPKIVETETAFRWRIERGQGAAEVRLSTFKTAEQARRYLLYLTQFIAEPLADGAEFLSSMPVMAMFQEHTPLVLTAGTPHTLLVQFGPVVLACQLRLGEIDLVGVMRDIVRRMFSIF